MSEELDRLLTSKEVSEVAAKWQLIRDRKAK